MLGRGAVSRIVEAVAPLGQQTAFGYTLQQVCHASSCLVCALPHYFDGFDHQRLQFYPGFQRIRFLVRGRSVRLAREFTQTVVLRRPSQSPIAIGTVRLMATIGLGII